MTNKTLTELREIAKKYEIKNVSKFKKEELISAIEEVMEAETVEVQREDNGKIRTETVEIEGILQLCEDGFGFLRSENYLSGVDDVYVAPAQIRRFRLKTGDMIKGIARLPRENERFKALLYVNTVNGDKPDVAIHRIPFENLTPIYPTERMHMVNKPTDYAMRLVDIIDPIGKGQRGIIVSPPKAGKTTMLKQIAKSIETNHPDVTLLVLLIDERPEEVTDMKRSINGEVIYSTFDEEPSNHIIASEYVLSKAKRQVEMGKDVVILIDSITKLTRAHNNVKSSQGKTLSGGISPSAFLGPKKFFGSARNIENGGSLTIIATALIETGSRMDDVVFEEFKGTGNMEIVLSRNLAEKKIFPAIDFVKSGTRREDLLLSSKEMVAQNKVKEIISSSDLSAVSSFYDMLAKTENNDEFISKLDGFLDVYNRG